MNRDEAIRARCEAATPGPWKCRIDVGSRFYVNENLPEMTEMYGNDSRKIGSDLYIDDKAENVRA